MKRVEVEPKETSKQLHQLVAKGAVALPDAKSAACARYHKILTNEAEYIARREEYFAEKEKQREEQEARSRAESEARSSARRLKRDAKLY